MLYNAAKKLRLAKDDGEQRNFRQWDPKNETHSTIFARGAPENSKEVHDMKINELKNKRYGEPGK